MTHRFFTLFVLISMLVGNFGTVFAQGELPPSDSDDPASLPKEAVLLKPLGSDLKNGGLAGSEISALATPTIVNGNFEQGQGVGWVSFSSNGYELILPSSLILAPPHGGSWAVWLGGEDFETSQITQSNISVGNPTHLRLWYWIGSEDVCGYDFGYVKINGVTIHTWNLCQATNTMGWVELILNLSAYSGQTVTLSISATTGATLNSNLFIDDVSLVSFADVSYDYWAQDFIQRLYNAGITGGCSTTPLSYCPESSVTRAQMAVFLEKGVDYPSSYSPPNVAPTFTDTVGHWAEDWIEALRSDGITGGCGSNMYCPENPVTRAQMAVFLLKAKYGSSYTPTSVGASTGFTDVPTSHWAAPWIKQLAAEGITGGCGTGIYCPESPVTRAQMAVFLVRTFGLP